MIPRDLLVAEVSPNPREQFVGDLDGRSVQHAHPIGDAPASDGDLDALVAILDPDAVLRAYGRRETPQLRGRRRSPAERCWPGPTRRLPPGVGQRGGRRDRVRGEVPSAILAVTVTVTAVGPSASTSSTIPSSPRGWCGDGRRAARGMASRTTWIGPPSTVGLSRT
ncbi:hypothetical protein [Tsukamurella soli]|uniref:hypothetical protein n=1 Tax=Tsukamurella soli TaxID=644556 RepID=UPI00361D0897